MGKKTQEMSQVYKNADNEFIFGENGGKGKHLSSFLKNISITGSSSRSNNGDYKKKSSDIYGNLFNEEDSNEDKVKEAKKANKTSPKPPQRSMSGPVGNLFSNLSTTTSPEKKTAKGSSYGYLERLTSGGSDKKLSSHGRHKYRDLDDDWTADLEDISRPSKMRLESNISIDKKHSEPRFLSNNLEDILSSPTIDALYPDLAIPVSINGPDHSDINFSKEIQRKKENNRLNQVKMKYSKIKCILTADTSINMSELRKHAWNGIPQELRALSWQLLLGYLPTNRSRRVSTLKRKRQEYLDGLAMVNSQINFQEELALEGASSTPSFSNSNTAVRDKQLYHQIKIDVKRTNPSIRLYSYPSTQESLRKLLFLWAVRHPASGYVQGINDLCTPFFQIFLSNYLWQLKQKKKNIEIEDSLVVPGYLDDNDSNERKLIEDPELEFMTEDNFDTSRISSRVRAILEADTYWCLSKLLETITDNYIHEQPGIIRQVKDLRNLISKIDIELLEHFDEEGIEFLQFSFRWINCLLMRELRLDLIVRMWDTYLSEYPLGFNNFHVYVCAAFLIKFSDELKKKDFQEIIIFLQNPPTAEWTERDIEMILSEAFIWQSLYKNASAHLR